MDKIRIENNRIIFDEIDKFEKTVQENFKILGGQ